MGTDVAEVVETLPSPRSIKVHRLMCTELMTLVDRVVKIFPDIEAARPRCSSGIQALCLLNSAIDKAKLLIQHCSESSKLYLALTGDKILSRCERSKSLLEHNLSHIQNMVPVMLASKIFQIIADLSQVTFSLDPSEEEACNAVKALLQQHNFAENSVQESAIEGIRVATSKLHLTSQKALLIERRSIRKLLDKVGDSDQSKKQILLFLLGLLSKYGKSIAREQEEDDNHMQNQDSILSCNQSPQRDLNIEYGHVQAQTEVLKIPIIPPEEFKCPISLKLMYDPVVSASGLTFERFWIQNWFDEGHDTCPKTKRKLVHKALTPNTAMKDLISKWCIVHGITIPDPTCIQLTEMNSWENSSTSINSLSISMNNLHLPVDFSSVSLGSLDNSQNSVSSHVTVTEHYHRFQSLAELGAPSLHKLDTLSWESQCKAVEDVMIRMKHENILMSSENIVEPLLRFLKDAHDRHDLKAQRIGCLLLLIFVNKCGRIAYLHEEAYSLLASFLDSEVIKEGLAVMEVLSCHECYRPEIAASGALTSILKILDTQIIEFQTPAMKILYNLTLNTDIISLIVSSELIPKLVPFFEDDVLARYCLAILKNVCGNVDARASIAETKGCISFIANILENKSYEEKEQALAILLSLCSQSVQYSQLVMSEGVIPAVVLISVNASDNGKAQALELLRLLTDIGYDDMQETPGPDFDISRDLNSYSKEKKSSSKAPGIFSKLSIFSRSSLVPKRKL